MVSNVLDSDKLSLNSITLSNIKLSVIPFLFITSLYNIDVYIPSKESIIETEKLTAEHLGFQTEGISYLQSGDSTSLQRERYGRSVRMRQELVPAQEADHARIFLFPIAGADTDQGTLYSERSEDEENGLVIVQVEGANASDQYQILAYDMNGRILGQHKFNAASAVSMPNAKGVIILKVIGKDVNESHKVIMK